MSQTVAAARPLLGQYRDLYADLTRRLSRAQSSAAETTEKARERSQHQLKEFASLSDKCAGLERDLAGERMIQRRPRELL